MKTYIEMAQAARDMTPNQRERMALLLLRIYEADRTNNNGAVNGEAVLCQQFSSAARYVLKEVGVLS